MYVCESMHACVCIHVYVCTYVLRKVVFEDMEQVKEFNAGHSRYVKGAICPLFLHRLCRAPAPHSPHRGAKAHVISPSEAAVAPQISAHIASARHVYLSLLVQRAPSRHWEDGT